MEPISTGMAVMGVGQILGNLFGNIFGAKTQANATKTATDAQARAMERAALLEKQAIDEALAYQKQIDERDYQDWLSREQRDYRDQWAMTSQGRKDFEASEQRKQPYRALGDSAVRTLANYIRVPGMQRAQEVPVSVMNYDPYAGENGQPPAWMQSGQRNVNTTMPVGGAQRTRTNTVADLVRG